MKTGALKRGVGLILLYCGLFVLIVLVQFSRNPGFSQRIGAFSLRVSYPKSTELASSQHAAAPDTVRMSYAGLSLEVSPKFPAEAVAADGSAAPLQLVSASALPNGASIKLSSGVEIRATVVQGQAERFSLSAGAASGVDSVRVKITGQQTLSFAVAGDKRTISIAGIPYDFSPSQASIDQTAGKLVLKAGDSGLAIAAVTAPKPVLKPAATPAAQTAAASQSPKDADTFRAEISSWRDKVWAGLSASRYDADKIGWKGPDGTTVFTERAMVAYIAEAALRGSYSDALLRTKPAKDRYPDKLTELSAPYLGSIYRKMSAADQADQAEVKRLAQLVSDKSPSLLEKEGLLRFLVDRAPSSLAHGSLDFIMALDVSKLTIRQSVGLLSCLADAKNLYKDESNPFASATWTGSLGDRLAAAVHRGSTGLYLATDDDGGSDLRLSLIAGESFIAYGQSAAKPNLVGLGQGLVEGVMNLSDAQGFSPSRLVPGKDGSADQKQGSLLPEDIYALLADNGYYPHEVTFAKDAGAGVWAWTCVPSLSLQSSGSRDVFLATFFTGKAHYMAIFGIKRFANIQLYDIDYSPDNDFESYDASGYRHDIDAGVLYLKMKHKKDVEDIRLSF